MKAKRPPSKQQTALRLQGLMLGLVLGCFTLYATAREPIELPEPSMLSLLGLGVIAGIVVWRLKDK